MEKRVAIIDVGSTSIRVIIMLINQNGSYRMLDQAKEHVRLSFRLSRDKRLHKDKMAEALEAIIIFKALAGAYGVEEIIAVATAAVRLAQNGLAFIENVFLATGIKVNIIDGHREAYLDCISAANTIALEDYILIDVGGGSTELALVKERTPLVLESLPLGSMNLTELFPVNKEADLKKLDNYIDRQLESLQEFSAGKGLPVVAVGGSARALAKIDKQTLHHPLEGIHNYILDQETCFKIYHNLAALPVNKRERVPGLDKKRSDIILGGLAPLMGLLRKFEGKEIYINGSGIREGLFFEYYHRNSDSSTGPVVQDVLEHSINNLLRNYDQNLRHSYHVQALALQLFDQLKPLHDLRGSERRILAAATALHDIGRVVNYYNHHMHTFYLVLHAPLYGLNNREKTIAAFIGGLHDGSGFSASIADYRAVLKPGDEGIIRLLSLLAEIAESLDRSETGQVGSAICSIGKEIVTIGLVQKNGAASVEYAATERTAKKFKHLFKRDLLLA
jgi:exopolyphosphatase / guanosine-5'-triphosphate,3'-diphosphate pyrophosphatase